MEYRTIGSTQIRASVLGLGTWVLGGWSWGGADDRESLNAIRSALDAGINLIDTAPVYGFGHSEEIVGRALRSVPRDSYVLASKCGLVWERQERAAGRGEWHAYSNEKGRTPGFEDLVIYRDTSSESIRHGVENSLRRLKVDYIDIMQIHHVSDSTTPIPETFGTLDELRREGKIRAIGISNTRLDQLEEYRACGAIDVVQERFSLLTRTIENNGVLDTCRTNSISLFAYSPLERGILTGSFDPNRGLKEGDIRKGDPKFEPEKIREVNRVLRELTEMTRSHQASIGELVIAWTVSQYEKMHVLCGARNREQALQNAMGGGLELTPEELEKIGTLFSRS